MTEHEYHPPSLTDLDARLQAARTREDIASGRAVQDSNARTGAGLGLRIAIELVVGIVVGAGMGYALDRWLGTRPWFMLVFFCFGAAAGVLNVYRSARKIAEG